MPTIKAGNISKGTFFMFRGVPCQTVKAEFYHPGKGSAVNRVRFRNLQTGSTQNFTFKSNEEVEVIDVSSREMQFLYSSGNQIIFMDPRTFDQVELSERLFVDTKGYLTPDVKVYVMMHEDRPLGVTLPPKVTLKVTDAPDAVAGNRINAPKKTVTLETGLRVEAPIFIKTGESLVIDTATGQYVSRG